MLKRFAVAVWLASLGLCFGAQAAPASAESVERLLALTQVEKLLVGVRSQTDSMMSATMARMLDGRNASAEDRQRMEHFQRRTLAVVREELSWEKLKPLYVQLYTEVFTQEEVDGLIAFYESPAGQAYIGKMPLITQKSMALMQDLMVPMVRKLQENVAEFMKDKYK